MKLFVYGTLMNGYRNYEKFLKGYVKSCESAYTKGDLYYLKSKDCPAIIEGNNKVYGEVMELVDGAAHVIDSIDELEKYFEGSDEIMYERKERTVFYEDGRSEELGVYIFINENFFRNNEVCKIESGSWNVFNGKQ